MGNENKENENIEELVCENNPFAVHQIKKLKKKQKKQKSVKMLYLL